MDFTSHGQLLGVLFIHYHSYCILDAYIYWITFIYSKPQFEPFLSFCFHIKGLHDICTAIFPQSCARAVLSCARLCSQANINPSSCFPAAKITHILLYKEAFCLPFVIPSSHHLTYWALVNIYSSTYSQLGILSYIFLSSLSQKYIYKSTSLTFNYKSKTRRIAH